MSTLFRAPLLAAIAVSIAAGCSPAFAQRKAFSFGLWGDMPYAKAKDGPKIPALIADMNKSDIAFSSYDGDIKDGSSICTDDSFDDALKIFGQFKKPVVYVPGDNEWTDCHRTNNGGYDNLERLAYLRKVMFSNGGVFGAEKMRVEHQGKPGDKFVENIRFSRDGVTFVTLNVPGSNNNKVMDEKDCSNKSARAGAQCAADNAEYADRDAANIAWMHDAFEKAKTTKDAGVMIVLQADLGFDIPETEEVDESRLPEKSGYAAFLDAVIKETSAYSGQVVLVHGDTHFYKIDKPLIDATHLLPNFTRVQTFGSPNVHWLRVTVDVSSPNVFIFHPMIVEANK
jgi:hypothetical protein